MEGKYQMKIASLPRQILILMWKNMIIFRCNLFGTALEFISPFVFLAFLLIIRYYIERVNYTMALTGAQPTNVFDLTFFLSNQSRNLVIFYPNNTLIQNFVLSAVQLLKLKNPSFQPKIIGSNYPSAFQLDEITISQLAVQYSFPSSYVNVLPTNIEYTIFTQEDSIFKYKVSPLFPSLIDFEYDKAPEDYCYDTTYFALYSSFNAFKFAMDLQIISYLTGTQIENTNILRTMQFNCPNYQQDEYHSTFAFFPSILVAVGFMFSTIFSLGNIVQEKSSKMKEYLKLVGIKWYAIWVSWWLRNIFIFLVLSATVTILCRITLPPTANNPLFVDKAVLMSTDPIILLMLLLTYSVQVCSFIILFSQFFKKPFDAKVSMLILWVATCINFYNYLPTSVLKYLLCIFPNMGLQFGFQVIFQFERSSRPLGLEQLFSNLYQNPLNLGSIMISMLTWSVFYLPVTWYMEKILPGDYGIPLPYYFPFLKSYWFPEFSNIDTLGRINSYHVGQRSFERDPKGLQKTVKIMNLSKTFKTFRTSKTVVKNVSINFFENQITGLLGHNGAGKTTTTFMLCGLYPPSSGTAQIFGYDLRTQIDNIRCIMGYCPQVNILFDEFTVREHLKLIAMIKGFPKTKIDDEINRISTFVGLSKDLSKKAKNLSGGMKRRLMVAMALMGDSKIIILDEPTSGLDPFNRVKLWELIRKYKNGRTIILTTHFMEEADALSDRIAIMNHGEIRCYGTPVFLKNYYGNGFRVKIVKNMRFNYREFESLINTYLKAFSIETNVAAELCISFGFDKVNILPEFLNQLEMDKETIGIDSYSVSSSTLEEVFLKVGKIDQKEMENENFEFMNVNESAFNSFRERTPLKTGRLLWLQQIKTLLCKRLIVFRRRYILSIMILLLPIVFEIILAIIIPPSSAVVDEVGQVVKSEGSINLDVRLYGSQELVYNLNTRPPYTKLTSLFEAFYTYSNRPQVNAVPLPYNGSVSNYVYKQTINDMLAFIRGHYFGIDWVAPDNDVNKFQIVAYFSKLAYNTPGAIVNEISNLLLSYLNRNKLDETITTFNEPLVPSYSKYYGNDFLQYLGCFDILPLSIFNFSVSLLLSFVISINVMHISREKINGSKKMQILSNTSKLVYWISNYMFDIMIYMFNLVSILAVILIVNRVKNDPETDIYLISSFPTLINVIFVVFVSSLGWPLYTYCWLHFFKSDVTAFAILLILLGVAGFADVLFSFVQIFIHVTDPDLDFSSPGSLIVYSIRILLTILFPNVTIKREFFDFRIRSNRYCISSLNKVIKTNYQYNVDFYDFAEPGVGLFLLISIIQIIITILLLIGIETNSLNREFIKNFFYRLINKNVKYIKINYKIENDVQQEIERVTTCNLRELATNEPLVVNRIVKLFKKKQMYFAAVDNLSFGVKAQRCFGLLGLNGAGKTTTFNMIIGEKEPDLGDVYINGYSIQGNQSMARQNLGYCPQFDRHVEYLTVDETLKMFSRLRGIEPVLADKISKDMLDIFQLQEFKNTLVQNLRMLRLENKIYPNLSGGNKRKVSCAIAFIGKPSVVILDEPSTGMDPGARKFLWNIIKKARDLGITIVLSSHSMEECEALCDKLAIMLNGQTQCFGTIPELKRRYGDGYRLIIKCNHSENLEKDILVLDGFIRMNFPSAFLEDKQYETLFYIVRSSEDDENDEDVDESSSNEIDADEESSSSSSTQSLIGGRKSRRSRRRRQGQNLSRMFSLIETHKHVLNIESYYISQTTLEQLFMSFANRSFQIDENQFRQNSFSFYFSTKRCKIKRKKKSFDSSDQLAASSNSVPVTAEATNTTTTSQIVLLSFRQFEEQPAYVGKKRTKTNDQYLF